MAQQTITTHPALNRIRERGYWRTIIRPAQFEPGRIGEQKRLAPLVERSATRFQIWEFPTTISIATEEVESDWVESAAESPRRPEYWRFYQSGQFLHYAGISEDWGTLSFRWGLRLAGDPVAVLPVYDTLYRLTEIFEFAARLALARDYSAGDALHIEIMLRLLDGRQLYNDASPSHALQLSNARAASTSEFRHALDVPISDLVAQTRTLALDTAEHLFGLFSWQAAPGLLQHMQEDFVEK